MSVDAAIKEQIKLCEQHYGVKLSSKDRLEAIYKGQGGGGSQLGKRGTRYKKKPGRKAPA